MKAVAPADRPREKLDRVGVRALGDNELVALLLGQGTGGRGAIDIANAIVSLAGGAAGLARLGVEDLRRVPGVGEARAAQIAAAMELGRRAVARPRTERLRVDGPRNLAEWLIVEFGFGPVERFGVVLLDTRHKLLGARIVSSGTLDTSVVHPREVLREGVVARAAAVIVFHNHPSGDPMPSPEDLALTDRLVRAGDIVGIPVLDHLILGDGAYYSAREAGYLRDGRRWGPLR